MSKLTGFLTRLGRAFNRRGFEQQMAAEMREHLEQEAAERVAKGENPATARQRVAVEFGHLDSFKELVRDRRLGHGVDELWRNVRFALRGLRRSRGFTFVAVATIAIGIGAGTAIFSLVNAILLRSLPVPNPQELRVVHWSGSEVRMRSINRDYHREEGARETVESFNHPAWVRLRAQAGDKADVFGFFPLGQVTALSSRRAFATEGLMVTDNFFAGLQITPLIGRVFAPGDDASGVPQVVLSHATWQHEFAGDPAILDRTIAMHGIDHPIIGVLPPEFRGVHPGNEPGLYVPMLADSPFLYVPLVQDWHWFLRLMARVHPGTSDEQLTSALTTAFAAEAASRMSDPQIIVKPGEGGLGFDRDAYGRPLAIMLGVTGLVMLVACANLAGLSLARGAARQHELAVRASLGASRRRLIVQSLTESGLLAGIGGALGVVLAMWGRVAISRLLAGSAEGLRYELPLDATVLGFALVGVVVTAVLAGLLPAWLAGRVNPLAGLQSRGAAGAPRLRLGRMLVVAQIGIALALLVAAGLGLRSLANLRTIDPGFNAEHLLVFKLNPASAGYAGAARVPYYDRVQAALEALPGVTGVALMQFPLLSEERSAGGFQVPALGALPEGNRVTYRQMVNESFFATMGIPLEQGRGFTVADNGDAPKVVVVNETLVRRYFEGRNPLGHVMTMWDAEWRIVGVCRDAKFDHLKEDIPPTTYFPIRQRFYDRFIDSSVQSAGIVVRTTMPLAALQPAVIKAVASVDPTVPVTALTAQTELLNRNIGQERMLATLGSALAGVALLLCCIGLFGLIAYDVTRRTGEIAIRMAIGAQRSDVARPILREAFLLAALGIGAGLPVVFGLVQLLRSQLYGVSAFDPATIGVVIVILIVVTALAAWLPAWRATRIDPIEALRGEYANGFNIAAS